MILVDPLDQHSGLLNYRCHLYIILKAQMQYAYLWIKGHTFSQTSSLRIQAQHFVQTIRTFRVWEQTKQSKKVGSFLLCEVIHAARKI